MLPGVLGAYEIRDVYAAAAPRPLLIVNPQDPRSRSMEARSARAECARALEIYEMLEAPDAIRIESGLGRSEIRTLLGDWLRSIST